MKSSRIARANQSTTGNHENLESTTVPYANLNTLTVFVFTSLIQCIIYCIKYVFKLWAENIFSKVQLKELSQKIKELNTATSIGRIPRKIGTIYGSYTAELKNGRIGL